MRVITPKSFGIYYVILSHNGRYHVYLSRADHDDVCSFIHEDARVVAGLLAYYGNTGTRYEIILTVLYAMAGKDPSGNAYIPAENFNQNLPEFENGD